MSIEAARTSIIWSAAVIAFLVGIGLCIAGFIVPPQGVINGSVLTALGELLAFFSSIFGVSEFTKIQIAKIKEAGKKKATDDSEDLDKE